MDSILLRRAHLLLIRSVMDRLTDEDIARYSEDQERDEYGRFSSGGGGGGGGKGPIGTNAAGKQTGLRSELRQAKTTEKVESVLRTGLAQAMGREVTVSLANVEPALAREYAEGLLRCAEKYPDANLGSVTTYDPTAGYAPQDPNGEAFAITSSTGGSHSDEIAFNTANDESRIRGILGYMAATGEKADPTPAGIATHEFGHVMTIHTNAAAESAYVAHAYANHYGVSASDYVMATISRYAAATIDELAAEAFGDVEAHGAAASNLSQDIHDLIVENYRQAGGTVNS